MKVSAEPSWLPIRNRHKPFYGMRSFPTDHPSYAEPSPYGDRWPGTTHITDNGTILNGAELGSPLSSLVGAAISSPLRLAIVGGLVGLLLVKSKILGIAGGGAAGYFLGPKLVKAIIGKVL